MNELEPVTLYLDDIWRCDLPKELDLGATQTLGDILDRLPIAHRNMAKLRKLDDDAYAYFSRVGAPLMFNINERNHHQLSQRFLRQRPARVGAFPCLIDDVKKFFSIQAAYMHKIERPVNVQSSNHDTYRVVALWGEGLRSGFAFYVSIDSSGAVAPLKQLVSYRESHARKTPTYKKESKQWSYYRMGWFFDEGGQLESCAREWETSVEEAATFLASVASSGMPDPRSFLVRTTKRKGSVAFRVHRRACAKFFADRDVDDKQNNKIFHYRRGYYRRGSGGGEVFVRPAYPGSRRFMWNGYRVHVSMPRAEATSFSAAGVDAADPNVQTEDCVSSGYMGAALSRFLDNREA